MNDAHVFTTSIAASPGSYVVKAADYEGGAFATASVTVGTQNSGNEQGNGTGQQPPTTGNTGETSSPAGDNSDQKTNTQENQSKSENTANESTDTSKKEETSVSNQEQVTMQSPKTGEEDSPLPWILSGFFAGGLILSAIVLKQKKI